MSTPPYQPFPGQQPGQQHPAAGPYQPYPGQQPGFPAGPQPGMPGMPQPGMQQPGMPQPGYQDPGFQQQGFQQQGYQQPGFQQPGFQQSGFQNPGFQQYPQQGYPQQPMYPQIGMGPGRIGGGGGWGPGPVSVKLAQIAILVTVLAWALMWLTEVIAGRYFLGGGLFLIIRFLVLGVAIPVRFLRTGSSGARVVTTVCGALYGALLIYSLSRVFMVLRYLNGLSWGLVLLDVLQLAGLVVAIVFLYRRDSNYFFSRR